MKKKWIGFVFAIAVIYSCTQSLYVPAIEDPAVQGNLMAGRKLYVGHCSGCHNLHFPKEYSAEQWQSQLDEMQVKAKISDAEKELIFQYLTAEPVRSR